MVLGAPEDQDQGVEPGTVFQEFFLGGGVTHEILQLGDCEFLVHLGFQAGFVVASQKKLLIDLIDQERRMSNPLKHLIICRERSKFGASTR